MKAYLLHLSVRTALVASALFASVQASFADPRQAEDVAYEMATNYIVKSFQMSPTDNTGLLGAGQAVRFLVPVSKGLDYVFLAGGDKAARDIDIYIYDEVGNLIQDDRRSQRLAGSQFRASYNGTAIVYLHMARADGLAAYCVLVGRRGVEKTSPAAPAPAPGGAATTPGS